MEVYLRLRGVEVGMKKVGRGCSYLKKKVQEGVSVLTDITGSKSNIILKYEIQDRLFVTQGSKCK